MAYKCAVCGKSVAFGHNISHSHRKTHRKFYPNLQKVRVKTPKGNKQILVCTRCLRSGKVEKAASVGKTVAKAVISAPSA